MENKKEIFLKKPKARTNILFIPHKEDDGWLIDVITIESKSGKQTQKRTIIRKDLEQWVTSYLNNGWVEIERDNKQLF